MLEREPTKMVEIFAKINSDIRLSKTIDGERYSMRQIELPVFQKINIKTIKNCKKSTAEKSATLFIN